VPTIVTIEGSILPSADLPRGERMTVVLTEKVQKRIDRGYVDVIETRETGDEAPAPKKRARKAAKKAAPKPAEQEVNDGGSTDTGDVPGDGDQSAAPGSGDGSDHSEDASPADEGDQEPSATPGT